MAGSVNLTLGSGRSEPEHFDDDPCFRCAFRPGGRSTRSRAEPTDRLGTSIDQKNGRASKSEP